MTYQLVTPGHHVLTMQAHSELEQNDEDNASRILSAYGDDLVFVSGHAAGFRDQAIEQAAAVGVGIRPPGAAGLSGAAGNRGHSVA